jgi:hypothetical protein
LIEVVTRTTDAIMNVRLSSLSAPAIIAQNAAQRVTRYDATFMATGFSGDAYFCILERSTGSHVPMQSLLNRQLNVRPGVKTITDFAIVSDGTDDLVSGLGKRGLFYFRGRITEHVFTGQGSIFQAGDLGMMINVDMLPADSLEVVPGTRVSFTADGFGLWMI